MRREGVAATWQRPEVRLGFSDLVYEGRRRYVQSRSVESHFGPRFSMQVCQQVGSWSMKLMAAAGITRNRRDVMIVECRERIVKTRGGGS